MLLCVRELRLSGLSKNFIMASGTGHLLITFWTLMFPLSFPLQEHDLALSPVVLPICTAVLHAERHAPRVEDLPRQPRSTLVKAAGLRRDGRTGQILTSASRQWLSVA